MLAVVNFSINYYSSYRIGVPDKGIYFLLMHSNEVEHGGTTIVLAREFQSDEIPMHGQPYSISIELPCFTFMLFSFKPKDIIQKGDDGNGS